MINVKADLLKPILVAIFSVATPCMVNAMPISLDLSISGSVIYDEINSFAAGTTQSGSISSTIGGSSTSSSISGATLAGTNPLGGALTNTGDGVGSSFTMSGDENDAAGGMFSDFLFDISNTSATDQYQITFAIELFANMADADGTDSYVDSQISLFDETDFLEVFFSDLTSDVYFGDQENGTDPGTFGAALSESGVFTFDVFIDPLATFQLTGFSELEGGVFDGASSFSGELSSFISIRDVANLGGPVTVPEPGMLLLMVTGLLGLVCHRKYRTKV